MRQLADLWHEYKSALLWEPQRRREWLEGLAPTEGANLFAELHNLERSTQGLQEISEFVEALNWLDCTEKMHKVARRMGITFPE